MKKDNIKILAGIVSYNPDIKRITENVAAVINQVDCLVMVDNGSANYKHIKDSLSNYNIEYISFSKNKGIAAALSEIMSYANNNGYDWVLSLDQDTVVKKDIIRNYMDFIEIPETGIVTSKMEDRNYKSTEIVKGTWTPVRDCFTSGTLMNTKAYYQTDGYDINLFIDRVDCDICYKLIDAGYKLIKINKVGFIHELGATQIRKFLWKKALVTNHNSIRKYYIFRNETYIRGRYPHIVAERPINTTWGRPMWKELLSSSIKVIMFEKHKIKKIFNSYKGCIDGKKMVKSFFANSDKYK